MTAQPTGRDLGWVLRSGASGEAGALSFRILPGGEKTIGRAKGVDFVIDAALVSRVHCRLTAHPAGQLEVQDLQSTNGTFVNDRRVTTAVLTVGDRLGVGRVELVVGRE
jgi:pSer/pThr/pTyr-binding forkhead associated (FHA) protein